MQTRSCRERERELVFIRKKCGIQQNILHTLNFLRILSKQQWCAEFSHFWPRVPFKWLLRALMASLEQRQTNAKHFKGLTFTCVHRLPIKVCQWSHLNTISTGFLFLQNNFASLGMDILAILYTNKMNDFLRPRHPKGTVSNKKLNLLLWM